METQPPPQTHQQTITQTTPQRRLTLTKIATNKLDINFAQNYEKNIQSLLLYKNRISGTHKIDNIRANAWIDAQKTPLKKTVARSLINITKYITLNDFFDGIEKLVLQHKEKWDNDNYYLYVGKYDKSFYFCALIVVYFLNKHSFHLPKGFIKEMGDFEYYDNAPIFMFDDMGYTGSQLGNLLSSIYLENINNLPNITVFLYGANSNSIKKISTVPSNINIYKRAVKKFNPNHIGHYNYIESPFHLYYYKKFNTTLEDLGVVNNTLLHYYFYPVDGQPTISVYFDHKMADDVSTFMRPLLYGPIIPNSYTYEYYLYKNDIIVLSSINDAKFETFDTIYELLRKDDAYIPENEKIDDTVIEFLPFLRNCPRNLDLENEIKRNLLYFEFTLSADGEYIKIFTKYHNKKTQLQNKIKTLTKIENNLYKCIYPFYKHVISTTATKINKQNKSKSYTPPTTMTRRRKTPTPPTRQTQTRRRLKTKSL